MIRIETRSGRSCPEIPRKGTLLLTLGAFLSFPFLGIAGERITVDGKVYDDAEMVDVAPDGAAYQVAEGEWVVLPWEQLSEAQLSAVKARFPGAIQNAMFEAHWIKGTVFQISDDGVIIQVTLPEDGDAVPPFRNGAVFLHSGLVIIKDVPTSVPQGEGAEIEILAHKRQSYTYDMGIAVKEIPYLTVARPLWGQEQEWINKDGQKMYARLLGVKDGKCLFEKGGQRFVYELPDLDAEGQKRAEEIAKKLAKFPLF